MGGLVSKIIWSSPSPYVSDPLLFATQTDAYSDEPPLPLTRESAAKSYGAYDYIIVGGGTAGCVLANRLSEDPNVKVLLVEAGGSHESQLNARVPVLMHKLFRTDSDWNYQTTPQSALNNRSLYVPRGKLLGGCSSLNAMLHHNCAPSDFDEWEARGNKGWAYKYMLPYFKKSESHTPQARSATLDESRGLAGPWRTRNNTYTFPITHKFIEACEEIGIEHTHDINTPRGTLGVTRVATFIDQRGQRSSSATAYLTSEVLKRKNLNVAVGCNVTKVIFSEDFRTSNTRPHAVGIELHQTRTSKSKTDELDPPRQFRVSARKEVVLCCGAINTPILLLSSGIGDKPTLESHGISLVKDLPGVGKYMSDHISLGHLTFPCDASLTMDSLLSPLKGLFYLLQWFLTGSGPMSTNIVEGAMFAKSSNKRLWESRGGDSLSAQGDISREIISSTNWARADIDDGEGILDVSSGENAPDIEVLSMPVGTAFKKGVPGFTLIPVILRPLSTGSVSLPPPSPESSHASKGPIINNSFLSHANDMRTAIRAVRLALRIGRTRTIMDLDPAHNPKLVESTPNPRFPTLRSNLKPSELSVPSNTTADISKFKSEEDRTSLWPSGVDPNQISDEELREYVRINADTVYHPVSTARMGPAEFLQAKDGEGGVYGKGSFGEAVDKGEGEHYVVNPELKVFGIDGLRVVDASVFPSQVSGHPTAVIIALAEKAADMIREARD